MTWPHLPRADASSDQRYCCSGFTISVEGIAASTAPGASYSHTHFYNQAASPLLSRSLIALIAWRP
jgi:hypothetical protein